MDIGWPQAIYLGLIFLSLGHDIAMHEKPRNNHNAFTTLLGSTIVLSLLWWGGFFGP